MVASGDRHDRAVRYASSGLFKLLQRDVAARTAGDEQGRCSDVAQPVPARWVVIIEFTVDGKQDRPVERQWPLRAIRKLAVPWIRGRCVFNDQSVDPGRLLLGDQIRQRPAQGVADERDPFEAQLTENTDDVISH